VCVCVCVCAFVRIISLTGHIPCCRRINAVDPKLGTWVETVRVGMCLRNKNG